MKKFLKECIIFIIGVLTGLASLFFGKKLWEKKNKTKWEIIPGDDEHISVLNNGMWGKIKLPKGTKLKDIKQVSIEKGEIKIEKNIITNRTNSDGDPNSSMDL
ncbi:MAG: hypothetical protein ACFFC1_03660 [Promethearchaeota archaeon]